jgi:hypothetical protein
LLGCPLEVYIGPSAIDKFIAPLQAGVSVAIVAAAIVMRRSECCGRGYDEKTQSGNAHEVCSFESVYWAQRDSERPNPLRIRQSVH